MGMPQNVQYIFRAITSESPHPVMTEEGFTDDYSSDLERFQMIAFDVNPKVVRITADFAFGPRHG